MHSAEMLLLHKELSYYRQLKCFTACLPVIIQCLICFVVLFIVPHFLAPLFETQCSYIEATMAQFLHWTQGRTDVGRFSEYSYSEYWAYADYKYIALLFQDQPFMFEVIIQLFVNALWSVACSSGVFMHEKTHIVAV